MAELKEIRPQEGPQTIAMASPADILIYGGAAGAGKSWFLVTEPLRHISNPKFKAAIVRQYSSQIFDQGGLWDEASDWYPLFGGEGFTHRGVWKFPSGAEIQFRHCEDERALKKWQGTQVAYLGVDEVTHFSETQFWWMVSRCRSVSGVQPYIRGTCNPDCDSFVADMIDWWIDQDSGYPIPDRRGVIRWMAREGGSVKWADSRKEFEKLYPDLTPRSFTFVDGSLEDNRILCDLDPMYIANLQGMPLVERERLLKGNWKIRHTAGGMFKKDWWQIRDEPPKYFEALIRYWDKAGSETGDYTAGVLMGRLKGQYWVLDVVRGRWTPDKRNQQIFNTAQQDHSRFNGQVQLWLERDAGAAGVEVVGHAVKQFAQFGPRFDTPIGQGSKLVRASPFAAQVEHGNVYMKSGSWNRDYIDEMAAFPTKGINDDQVDASSGGFNRIVTTISMVPSSYVHGYRNPVAQNLSKNA